MAPSKPTVTGQSPQAGPAHPFQAAVRVARAMSGALGSGAATALLHRTPPSKPPPATPSLSALLWDQVGRACSPRSRHHECEMGYGSRSSRVSGRLAATRDPGADASSLPRVKVAAGTGDGSPRRKRNRLEHGSTIWVNIPPGRTAPLSLAMDSLEPMHRVGGMAFRMYSAEEVLKTSVKEITLPVALDPLGHPVPGCVCRSQAPFRGPTAGAEREVLKAPRSGVGRTGCGATRS